MYINFNHYYLLLILNGRDGRIRTDDHYTPSVVRYQAALHPVNFFIYIYHVYMYNYLIKHFLILNKVIYI